jgi:hypothetical protein
LRKFLIGSHSPPLWSPFRSLRGVDDDRRDLDLKLLYVQSLLADAEAKAVAENEAGRAVKGWMRELKAAAY